MLNLRNCRLGVFGLGCVGLPLAVEFGKHFDTIGFDIKAARIAELQAGRDSKLEVPAAELAGATRLLSPRASPTSAAAASASSPCRHRSTSTSGPMGFCELYGYRPPS